MLYPVELRALTAFYDCACLEYEITNLLLRAEGQPGPYLCGSIASATSGTIDSTINRRLQTTPSDSRIDCTITGNRGWAVQDSNL
jgi:hypothetical protein